MYLHVCGVGEGLRGVGVTKDRYSEVSKDKFCLTDSFS